MASSPEWKVYDRHGTYQAAVKEPEAAAALVSWYGDGSTVRHGHSRVVWTEGRTNDGPAGMDYDGTATIIMARGR